MKNLILLAFILTSTLLFAQNDFRPGYIITNSGDSISGKIDYRTSISLSKLCRFKDENDAISEYSPGDIYAFRFNDSKYYISKTIDEKQIFLEYLIKGKVSVYYLATTGEDHYFIEKDDLGLRELPYIEDIRDIEGEPKYYQSNVHLGFLKTYMQDAPSLESLINSIKKPEYRPLIKLAEDYHNIVCNDEECIIFEKSLPLVKVSITPVVGFVKYNGYSDLIPEYGGYISICSPWTSDKFSFKTGFLYDKTDGNSVIMDNVERIIRIPLTIEYLFKTERKIQTRIGGGLEILNFKDIVYKEVENTSTFVLNAGLIYNFSNNASFDLGFTSNFRSISESSIAGEGPLKPISFGINFGLRFDL